jgi:hypothetical protein
MEEVIDLKDPRVVKAFNEWMRRFIEHPEQFAREWQTVAEFQRESGQGAEPSYGEVSVGYLQKLISES